MYARVESMEWGRLARLKGKLISQGDKSSRACLISKWLVTTPRMGARKKTRLTFGKAAVAESTLFLPVITHRIAHEMEIAEGKVRLRGQLLIKINVFALSLKLEVESSWEFHIFLLLYIFFAYLPASLWFNTQKVLFIRHPILITTAAATLRNFQLFTPSKNVDKLRKESSDRRLPEEFPSIFHRNLTKLSIDNLRKNFVEFLIFPRFFAINSCFYVSYRLFSRWLHSHFSKRYFNFFFFLYKSTPRIFSHTHLEKREEKKYA